MRNRLIAYSALLYVVSIGIASAQQPSYQNLRFNEDWSTVPEGESGDLFDPIKNIEISDSIQLTLGGSARYRYESWDDFGFGAMNDDAFSLFRFYLHSDWRIGDSWRVYVEGRATTVNNRDLPGGKRAALDIDEYDLWNTFVEGQFPGSNLDVTVRVGRQELQYGAQRLISPLDWANNRRIFDGGLVRIKSKSGWMLDAFVTAPVMIDPDEFTWNDTDHTRLFSALYYSRPLKEGKYKLDAYLLALNHIDDAPVEDDRYTVGFRLNGKLKGNWTFDTEAAIQFGERDYTARQRLPTGRFRQDEDILAWMFTAEAKYTFAEKKWKPWFVLGVDLASGDDDPKDDDNNTFSHLFPLAHAYIGFADIMARQNVIGLRTQVGAWPIAKRLRLRGDVHFLWLESEDDGLYGASGALARSHFIATPGGRIIGADESEVGTEVDLTLLYKIDRHADVLFGFSHVFAGDFIDDTGANKDISLFYTQLQYKF